MQSRVRTQRKSSPARRVRALVAIIAVTFVALATGAHGESTRAARPTVPLGTIQHVVVIYQENHSFDETLGAYCVAHPGRCNGTIGPVHLKNGTTVALTPSPDTVHDIPHSVGAQSTAIDGGAMDGWSGIAGCVVNNVNLCLTYYKPTQIPTLTALADKYAISDRTFSMQNSPSWGGHVYAAAATQDGFTGDIPQKTTGVTPGPGWGCNSNRVQKWIDPLTHASSLQPACIPAAPGVLNPTQFPYNGAFRATKVPSVPTIFDRLQAKGLSWHLYSTIYVWSICPNFASCLDTTQRAHTVPTSNVLTDAKNGTLPAYSAVLPSGPGGTGQHPPSSMLLGDNWIGKVVSAIQAGPQWSSTAIFITYDDCGCFYDHVTPGKNPDGTQQGIRVPMVIVSPYAKVGYTDTQPATFSSILHFTEESLGLAPLGVNDAGAYDFAGAFNFSAPPTGARVELRQHPIPASTRRFLAQHPEVVAPDDDT